MLAFERRRRAVFLLVCVWFMLAARRVQCELLAATASSVASRERRRRAVKARNAVNAASP